VTLAAAAAGCGGDSTGPDGGTTTGAIAVAVTTTGSIPDPDGYTVSLDGGAAEAIGVNENRTLTQMSTGDHTIALAGVAENCAVAGVNPRTVTVSAGGTAQAALAVTCDAPLTLSGTIAFETNRTGDFEIFSMNADGTGATYPVWSPDGGFIAFRSDREGNIEIFAMESDGGSPQNLTMNGVVDCHPTWSETAGPRW
jgi:hypothetical protein